jgi:mono/diheme cytochrome c family protein
MEHRLFSAVLMLAVGAIGMALLGSGYANAAPPADTPAARYQTECGACHMAYPAKLLPAGTWTRIMGGLDQHFGDNAELSPALRDELTRYLTDNARRSRTATDATPLRITDQRWFLREHREIPKRMVTSNDKVRSFSNCAACHGQAAQGRFSEHGVRIPGYGGWED